MLLLPASGRAAGGRLGGARLRDQFVDATHVAVPPLPMMVNDPGRDGSCGPRAFRGLWCAKGERRTDGIIACDNAAACPPASAPSSPGSARCRTGGKRSAVPRIQRIDRLVGQQVSQSRQRPRQDSPALTVSPPTISGY